MGLVNLKDLKKFIHYTESEDNSLLKDILDGELATLDKYVNQKLEQEEITEYYDGERDNIIILKNGFVTAVAHVKIDYDADGTYEEELTYPDEYAFKLIGEIIKRAGYFPEGIQNIEVKYTHGFTADNIPGDLKLAILKQCANTFSATFNVLEEEGEAKKFSQKSIDMVFAKYKRYTV